jgi:predicted nucleic acid-binding protein
LAEAEPVLVLDASVPLGWALPDEGRGEPARGVLASLGRGKALVPVHWQAEIGNGLLMALRRGRLQPEGLAQALAALSVLPVTLDDAGARNAWTAPLAKALATGLTLYDALYLELAARHGLPLATFDAALRRAALETGVAIVP